MGQETGRGPEGAHGAAAGGVRDWSAAGGSRDGREVPRRARIAREPLVTVPVKFPRSMVEAMDDRTTNRSELVRRAVAAYL